MQRDAEASPARMPTPLPRRLLSQMHQVQSMLGNSKRRCEIKGSNTGRRGPWTDLSLQDQYRANCVIEHQLLRPSA
jgi:hypothetical protein